MRDPISTRTLLAAIRKLPSDPPVRNPKTWYLTQKEHWIGWLSEYDGPGAYGRQPDATRDARYAFNHVVNPLMLVYIASASGVDPKLVASAKRACNRGNTMMRKSGAIRKIVPWPVVAAALWRTYKPEQSA